MSESLETPALPVDGVDATDILDKMVQKLSEAGGCFNLCLNVFDFEAVIYSLHLVIIQDGDTGFGTTFCTSETPKINRELLSGIAKTMGLKYPDA